MIGKSEILKCNCGKNFENLYAYDGYGKDEKGIYNKVICTICGRKLKLHDIDKFIYSKLQPFKPNLHSIYYK